MIHTMYRFSLSSVKSNLFVLFQGKTLALPEGVVKSIKSQSCDPEGVVVQLQENLQLNPSALDNPEPETKRWIRCLANAAKSENRKDVVQHLRTITPAGTTGG